MTFQKLATLSVDSNLRPILVLDPGGHLAIGRIIQGLKVARTGLWPKHLGGTDILISASKGKEIEIYKLAATLTAQGYYLQETEEHKKLEQTLAERKAYAAKVQAEMKAKAAKSAIPPMTYVVKRFSFRPHPKGVQVSFFSHGDFIRWAKSQNIGYTNLSRHRAIIRHLPVGCTLKFDRTPKSTWVQPVPDPTPCPWVQPPVPVAEPEPAPNSSWTKDQIKQWCEDRGLDTLGLTRKAQFLELIQEVQH